MGEVVAARKAYDQAQLDARALVQQARLNLGRKIYDARQQNTSQKDIADEIRVTRERARLFQTEYTEALAKGEEPADPERLAAMAVRMVDVMLLSGLERSVLLALLEQAPDG
jgi:small-conductance mechanosensitive channel